MRTILRIMRKPAIDALFPKTRQKIFSAIFLNPDKWWYMSDLANFLEITPSSLQRELVSLVAADILELKKEGNRVYYRAQMKGQLFFEIQAIMVKTVGLVDVLKKELKKHSKNIELAFVYGSIARLEDLSDSDVDLMIIGDIQLLKLAPSIRKMEKILDREVNPTIYNLSEFHQKIKSKDGFLTTVVSDKKILIKGNLSEFEALDR